MSEAMFATITDHTTQAKARQVEFFKSKTNFDKLIALFVDRLQLLEAVIVDFRDKRHIDGAEGVQIDGLGLVFQELRNGLGDEPYRAAVRSSYTKKAKSGEPETLIQAYAAYTDATRVKYTRLRPCTVILQAEVTDPTALETTHINGAMQKIRAGGIDLDCTISKDSGAFSFISASDLPDPLLGWSSIAAPTSGGTLGEKI